MTIRGKSEVVMQPIILKESCRQYNADLPKNVRMIAQLLHKIYLIQKIYFSWGFSFRKQSLYSHLEDQYMDIYIGTTPDFGLPRACAFFALQNGKLRNAPLF